MKQRKETLSAFFFLFTLAIPAKQVQGEKTSLTSSYQNKEPRSERAILEGLFFVQHCIKKRLVLH